MTQSQSQSQLEAEAIANCDKDPIHLLNSIQGYAWLVATDRKFEKVLYVSENLESLFDTSVSEALSTAPDWLFPSALAHRIRNAAGHRTIEHQREYVGFDQFKFGRCDVSVHAVGDCLITEIQPAEVEESVLASVSEVQLLVARLGEPDDLNQLLSLVVDNLRSLSGYDRVKAYRFLPDGAGEVVAESARSGVDSFLGLRFPAFDIPTQARKLYLSTPIRVIADVQSRNVGLIGATAELAPLDLSLALTRGTLDAHMQYLSNMGVRSTMTLPIVINDELWGLFAFHHYDVRVPGTPVTMAAELAGKMISLILAKEIQRGWSHAVDSTEQIAASVLDGAVGEPSDWKDLANQLLQASGTAGVALIFGSRVTASAGELPSERAVLATKVLIDDISDDVVAIEDLRARLPDHELGSSAGAAIIEVAGDIPFSVVLFRNELIQDITWAGAPEKKIAETIDGLRLMPRASFKAYIEHAENRCAPWTQEEIQLLYGLQSNLSRMSANQSELRVRRNRLELYVRELNHRVRNILSLVQSMTRQSQRDVHSVEVFAEQLEQRIASLAVGHDLLTSTEMNDINLRDLVERSLAAFIDLHPGAICLRGTEQAILPSDIAPLISLVLHELASNATRHGALTVPTGRVSLEWSVESQDLCLDWREFGGPPVASPKQSGFGRSIIENAIPHELDGTSSLVFNHSGVEFRAVIPKRLLLQETETKITSDAIRSRVAIDRGRALVVEDSFLISADLVNSLEQLGFSPVDCCSNNTAALDLIKHNNYSFCVLDVNLRGEFIGPVADSLAQLGTPFIFATGLGSRNRDLDRFPALTILTKPVRHIQLEELISRSGL